MLAFHYVAIAAVDCALVVLAGMIGESGRRLDRTYLDLTFG